MDRHSARRERVVESFKARGIDALLILSEVNVVYLTGFTGHESWLYLTRDRAVLISDSRFTTQLSQECPDCEALIRPIGQPMADGAGELIERLGLRHVGIEKSVLTVAQHERLREVAPTTAFREGTGLVEALRMIKDADELAQIRRAIEAAETAFLETVRQVSPDTSEKEIADHLEWAMKKAGAEGPSFPTIVAVGPRAALPHARPLPTSFVRDGELLLIDWGASLGGYKSDLTRVLPTGKVTGRLEQVYQTVLVAQARAIAAIRPGVFAKVVDAEARSVINEAGFGPYFIHSIGHGLGLEIHESPIMRGQTEIPLQPGMVVTVEPGIYLPEWGGVRIEDDVLVTEDGAEVLTHVSRSLEDWAKPFA